MQPTDETNLRDAIDVANRIADYVAGLSLEAFQRSQTVQDAVFYRFATLGEIVANISQSIRIGNPNVDWSGIIAFRHRAVRGSFATDPASAWIAATNDVPALLSEFATILERRDVAEVVEPPLMQVRPDLVVHADWSTSPKKRWMARAALNADGRYHLAAPEPVTNTATLGHHFPVDSGETPSLLVGFDFPIGLPSAYARRTGIVDFVPFLQELSRGYRPSFFDVAWRLDEVSLERPFFPNGNATGLKQSDFLDVLGCTKPELYRRCEIARPDRAAAAPLFWTVGGNQVGKAAIAGWREVLCPALADPTLDVAIWPFAGTLVTLIKPGRVVVAETYPAECYIHLGLDLRRQPTGGRSGKRVQSSRAANAPELLTWADDTGAVLERSLVTAIEDGFGPNESGEDQFDAVVGLMGMLNVILGRQPSGEPDTDEVRRIEGWILGQPA